MMILHCFVILSEKIGTNFNEKAGVIYCLKRKLLNTLMV
jgi:hypothetical protein